MAKKELSQIRVSSSSSTASTASASSEAFSSLALTLEAEATVTELGELASEALATLGDLSWLFCKEDKSPGFRC